MQVLHMRIEVMQKYKYIYIVLGRYVRTLCESAEEEEEEEGEEGSS